METITLFLLILLFGYLGTGLAVRKISGRNYIPTGVEYLLLGLLLSPALYGLIAQFVPILPKFPLNNSIMEKLNPVIAGATGFLGLFWGMKFNLVALLRSNREHVRVAFYDLLLNNILIGSVTFGILYYIFGGTTILVDIIFASLSTAIMVSLPTPWVVRRLQKKFKLRGKLTDSMIAATSFSRSFSLLMFGLLFPVYHILTRPGIFLTATEFVALGFGIAIVLGILFFIFLGRETNSEKIIAGILGITLLGSGVGYYLGLSPLFLCFILGILIGNLSSIRERITNAVHGLITPLSAVTVIFAGITWVVPEDYLIWVAVLLVPLIKLISKAITHRISYAAAFDKESVFERQGSVFLLNDILVFALLVNYATVFSNSMLSFVVNATFISAIVFSISASGVTKKFLVESDEITGGVE
ncbi:MAG: hypothetical protein LC102_11325 [Ignavibacteriales bacterium]|nr:MAG: hypothetical protein F9K26_01915 [Ignavibacteriaceae bacterium]MBW7872193.1 hypothetical protein [Ignavibacteria bacterium]MCZ2144006.1 hypothetical protein [Ignavibacteriales bacterium]OQY78501.1 MAG: hypothetical protein B6D45_02140 [Ignavibacteriales bacterium UTCHB3]MBV6445661.1 hypothetical protein [Ignavibacteriaceae bacterium]